MLIHVISGEVVLSLWVTSFGCLFELEVVRKADPAVIAAKPTGRKIVELHTSIYSL